MELGVFLGSNESTSLHHLKGKKRPIDDESCCGVVAVSARDGLVSSGKLPS